MFPLFLGFLVIGIPTVSRKKTSYLVPTLQSLVSNLRKEEKGDVQIAVFVADLSTEYRQWVKEQVSSNFKNEIESGLIIVFAAPTSFYPDLENLLPFFGDSTDRVKWRSKQCLDYSYLYYYCSDMSDYFLLVEDDIIAETGYLQRMKEFIKLKSEGRGWKMLQFGARGFIGMLYHSKDVLSLAKFIRKFFWTMPIDWLFSLFNDVHFDKEVKTYGMYPPLFLHAGTVSSLDGQSRGLEDLEERIVKVYQTKPNPPANISSTIDKVFDLNNLENLYRGHGVFWAKHVEKGNTIDIALNNAVPLKRVVFASGSKRSPNDRFYDTALLTSSFSDRNGLCSRYKEQATFLNKTVIDFTFDQNELTKCIRLQIIRAENFWLLVTEIAIFV